MTLSKIWGIGRYDNIQIVYPFVITLLSSVLMQLIIFLCEIYTALGKPVDPPVKLKVYVWSGYISFQGNVSFSAPIYKTYSNVNTSKNSSNLPALCQNWVLSRYHPN